ncbi:unnamed protein product, partial [Amoebophrya sp. A25]
RLDVLRSLLHLRLPDIVFEFALFCPGSNGGCLHDGLASECRQLPYARRLARVRVRGRL